MLTKISAHRFGFTSSYNVDFVPLVFMPLSLALIELIKVFYGPVFPSTFTLIALLYVVGYLYVIVLQHEQYSVTTTIVTALFIKFLITSSILLDDAFARKQYQRQIERFHIPYSLAIMESGGYLESLFSLDMSYNGRLTHIVIICFSIFLSAVGLDGQSISQIAVLATLLSFVFCPFLIFLYYVIALRYSNSEEFARRAAFFLGLNPFFLQITSVPQKEVLLYLSVGLVLYGAVGRCKNHLIVILGICILLFERAYLVPLVVTILLTRLSNIPLQAIICIIGCLILEMFIGIERAFVMYLQHRESLIGLGGSFLPGNDIFSNIIRGAFGPFFLRPVWSEMSTYGALDASKYFLFPFFDFCAASDIQAEGFGNCDIVYLHLLHCAIAVSWNDEDIF